MKQKLFSCCIFLLIFTILSFFYGQEYLDFVASQETNISASKDISELLTSFDISEIQAIEGLELHTMPSKSFLNTFIEKINGAQNRIYVEVYIFTEKRSREALIAAKKRGVDVRVLLEKNPYMATNINNDTFTLLQKSGIDVVWSNPKLFSLNHAKFYLIDQELLISTGNLSYSIFTKNRDFFLVTPSPTIVSSFEKIFLGDIEGRETFVYEPRIILSPLYSRHKITQLISSAQKTIDMYFQYLSDEDLQTLLEIKEKNNVQVRIIMDKKFIKESYEKVELLQKKGIEFFPYFGPTMHAKAILVDQKILYIGSVNFSTYSLDANRETGLLVTNRDVILQFQNLFTGDIASR